MRRNPRKLGAAVVIALVAGGIYQVLPTGGSLAATLPGDVNGDGKVDIVDLSALLSQYGKPGTADINGNGMVDITDMSIFLSNFGKTGGTVLGPPAAPTGVTATPGTGKVNLNWNDNTESDFSYYAVRRSTQPDTSNLAAWTRLPGNLTTSQVTDTDTALVPGTSCYYYVTAIDTAGEISARSAIVSATPTAGATPTPQPGATPIFNGSSFGPSGVAPFLQASCSSASANAGSGNYCTIGNPSSHGPSMVADPSGIARQVIKLTTDEAQRGEQGSPPETVVRDQMASPYILQPNNTYWVVTEYYFPTNLPTVAGWMTIGSIYGQNPTDSGLMTIGLNPVSGVNRMVWRDEDHTPNRGQNLWSKPATRGVWHVLARKVSLSASTSTGFMEMYYAQRGQPLASQALQGTLSGQTRRYFATLNPYNGTTAHTAWVNNYHMASMSGWSGLNSVYVASHKVYAGGATLQQIDPYYVGDMD